MPFKPTARSERKIEAEEPNLIPIMNLMVILIPMLLLNYHFITLAMLNTSLPASGEGAPEQQQQKKKEEKPRLNLTITITDKGFFIAGAGGVLVKGKGPTIPLKTDDPNIPQWKRYDYDKLNEELIKIKKKFPYEQDVIIAAEPNIKYQTIISTMDAVRKVKGDTPPGDLNGDGKIDSKDLVLFPGINLSPGIF